MQFEKKVNDLLVQFRKCNQTSQLSILLEKNSIINGIMTLICIAVMTDIFTAYHSHFLYVFFYQIVVNHSSKSYHSQNLWKISILFKILIFDTYNLSWASWRNNSIHPFRCDFLFIDDTLLFCIVYSTNTPKYTTKVNIVWKVCAYFKPQHSSSCCFMWLFSSEWYGFQTWHVQII